MCIVLYIILFQFKLSKSTCQTNREHSSKYNLLEKLYLSLFQVNALFYCILPVSDWAVISFETCGD